MYPSGAIVDRLDLIPPAQHDKLIVLEDEAPAVPLVKATVTIRPAKKAKDSDPEC